MVDRYIQVEKPVSVVERVEVTVLPTGEAWPAALREFAKQITSRSTPAGCTTRDLGAVAQSIDEVLRALARRPAWRRLSTRRPCTTGHAERTNMLDMRESAADVDLSDRWRPPQAVRSQLIASPTRFNVVGSIQASRHFAHYDAAADADGATDTLTHHEKGNQMNDVSQVVYALGRQEAGVLTLLGTGFAVGPRKVATAFHVTGANDEGLVIVVPRFPNMLAYQDTSDSRVNSIAVRIVAADPLKDLCVLEFVSPDSQISLSYGLSGTDSVPPGAPVLTLGFPHANSGRMVLTQQVAHVGARILIENSGQKSKHIVLNTLARDGQSGGPVFDADLSSVVAVLLGSYARGGGGGISLGGVDPTTLHQTTHAISAEYLGAML